MHKVRIIPQEKRKCRHVIIENYATYTQWSTTQSLKEQAKSPSTNREYHLGQG